MRGSQPTQPGVWPRRRELRGEAQAERFTALTRAPGSIGKVTREISHRSILSSRRRPVGRSARARSTRKPIERPSTAPSRIRAWISRARSTARLSLSAHRRPRRSSCDGKPAPDRLRGIVLPEHANVRARRARAGFGEGAGHDHVLAEIGDAEQARIAFETPSASIAVSGSARNLRSQDRRQGTALHRNAPRDGLRLRASRPTFSSWRTKSQHQDAARCCASSRPWAGA